jgi:predicted AAA+ superfamily ATPase
MISRPIERELIETALGRSRVVALIGPRQSGKTTLARDFVPVSSINYFDLEDPTSLVRLEEPMIALRGLTGTVVIDEIQRQPDLFPILRVLADREPSPARFLILGSASPDLVRQSSESLAGRVETIQLDGFRLSDVGAGDQIGRHFIQTMLERDLPHLGVTIPAATLRRFWTMLAHYHGQVWNGAELARALSIAEPTVRRYLDIMTGVFMIRQLPPWFENLGKRQVKSPKIYIRDSGLLHSLLGIHTQRDLEHHPKLGASWEGYAIDEILKAHRPDEAYFWATHGGAELDLLMFIDGRRIGVEVKRSDGPRATRSTHVAMNDLRLDELRVVYPGEIRYELADRIDVVPLASFVGAQ